MLDLSQPDRSEWTFVCGHGSLWFFASPLDHTEKMCWGSTLVTENSTRLGSQLCMLSLMVADSLLVHAFLRKKGSSLSTCVLCFFHQSSHQQRCGGMSCTGCPRARVCPQAQSLRWLPSRTCRTAQRPPSAVSQSDSSRPGQASRAPGGPFQAASFTWWYSPCHSTAKQRHGGSGSLMYFYQFPSSHFLC